MVGCLPSFLGDQDTRSSQKCTIQMVLLATFTLVIFVFIAVVVLAAIDTQQREEMRTLLDQWQHNISNEIRALHSSVTSLEDKFESNIPASAAMEEFEARCSELQPKCSRNTTARETRRTIKFNQCPEECSRSTTRRNS